MQNKRRLITLICLLLGFGYAGISLINYQTARTAIREAIVGAELPLTSDNIYSEIQKDLIRPVFVSSMMAHDTFVRDWVLAGEKDVDRMTRYLAEVRARYGTITSFFVSDQSHVYYHADGVLKHVRQGEWRDEWYFRVRTLREPYEINVDVDMANRDALTIFVNHRVADYEGHFIGATGVGLTVHSVRRLIDVYQLRYNRGILFVAPDGKVMLSTRGGPPAGADLHKIEGFSSIADSVLKEKRGSFQYTKNGREYLVNARFIPELNWYLLVEKWEDEALADIRRVLVVNLGLCAVITALVILAVSLTINRYQSRLEEMATVDKLTGLANRQAFDILLEQAFKEARRDGTPLSLLLVDIDDFKDINDQHGHLAGDAVIRHVAEIARQCVRESDLLCRWGGEEYLAALRGCGREQALTLAESIRARIQQAGEDEPGPFQGLTVSIGVATLHTGDTPDSLFRRSDSALYAAKADGRNKVRAA
ncbi:sensor domain-containing diguanylate cyclase [Desulfovibrio aminophilus]|uniref:sensor domain-containing diguanylate cyclase n=1 Tax=Desulfovibrio aminophilus TaxID=81425 RepID=UPI0003FE5E92|nr:sensor domain-containing diguanylate cyclase [Desulfovibrio aminophilus]